MNRTIDLQEKDIELFRTYLYERENSEATIQKYTTDVKTFFRYLEEREVNKAILLEYKQWLIEHYAITSANTMIVSLNQFLLYKEAAQLRIKGIKCQKRPFLLEEKNLTRKEYFRLLETAYQKKNKQIGLIIETIASTGIRISELKFFTVQKLRKGRIDIYNKGKTRVIIVPSKLCTKLLCYATKNGITQGSIFLTRNGKIKNRTNVWYEMKKLCEKAQVESDKVFPHNLRHLFARCYYRETKDLFGLADLLGHNSLETTRIYTTESGDYFQKKVESLELGFKVRTT